MKNAQNVYLLICKLNETGIDNTLGQYILQHLNLIDNQTLIE
jgi:hypothetical protein